MRKQRGEKYLEISPATLKLAQLKTTTMGEGACREVFEDDFLEQSLSQRR